MPQARLFALLLTSAFAGLSACSGGASANLPAHGSAVPAEARVAVRFIVPKSTQAFARAGTARRVSGGRINPFFVSASTNGVDVKVYAASDSGRTTPLAESTADVSPGSDACGGASGTPRTCVVEVPAPSGTDAFSFATYDVPPANGTFGGSQLAAANVTQTIKTGVDNAVNVTLGGIAASVALTPSVTTVRGLAASRQNVAVNALDADGNVIVSDGYVNASGTPVSIALSLVNAGGPYGGTFTLGQSALSAPASSGVSLNYDGNASLGPAGQSGANIVTIVAAAPTLSSTATATVATTGPSVAQLPIPTSFSGPYGAIVGTDALVWFTETNGNKIGAMATDGSVSQFPIPTANSQPTALAFGSDGNVWFTEKNANQIGKLDVTSHAIAEYPVPAAGAAPDGIVSGADGRLYFIESANGKIDAIATNGVISAFATPAYVPHALATGPDNRLWAAGGGGIEALTVPAAGATDYPLAGANFWCINSDAAAGRLVATDNGNGMAVTMTTAGLISSIAPMSPSTTLTGIAAGGDGDVWFLDRGGRIGRFSPDGTKRYEYVLPGSGITPQSITPGADGNLWFTENGASKIGVMTW